MADAQVAAENLFAQESLIAQLVQARIEAGLTVEDVAADCGCDIAYIQRLESFDYDPTLSELRHYALSVGALIDYTIAPLEGSTK